MLLATWWVRTPSMTGAVGNPTTEIKQHSRFSRLITHSFSSHSYRQAAAMLLSPIFSLIYFSLLLLARRAQSVSMPRADLVQLVFQRLTCWISERAALGGRARCACSRHVACNAKKQRERKEKDGFQGVPSRDGSKKMFFKKEMLRIEARKTPQKKLDPKGRIPPFGRLICFRFRVKCVVGLATTCPVKDNFWSRKGGFHWTKKRWRPTSTCDMCLGGAKVSPEAVHADRNTTTPLPPPLLPTSSSLPTSAPNSSSHSPRAPLDAKSHKRSQQCPHAQVFRHNTWHIGSS